MRHGAIRIWEPRRLRLQTQYSLLIAKKKKKSVTLATDTKKKSYPCYQESFEVIAHMAQETKYYKYFIRIQREF